MESYLSVSLQPPKVFISSRQDELADERAYVKENLLDKGIDSFAFESDTRASPSSPQRTFLEALSQSDIYVGIFYRQYSEATMQEYQEACERGIPCLVYVKCIGRGRRDPRLKDFLNSIKKKHVYREFDKITELHDVYQDVLILLANSLRTLKGLTVLTLVEPRPSKLLKLAVAELGSVPVTSR